MSSVGRKILVLAAVLGAVAVAAHYLFPIIRTKELHRVIDEREKNEPKRPKPSGPNCRGIGIRPQWRLGSQESANLSEVQGLMDRYRERHGRYPGTFHELGDSRWRAAPGADRFRGYNRQHLVIAQFSDNSFVLQTVDDKGRVTWQLRSDDADARAVAPSYCTLENEARAQPATEAPSFLTRARFHMRVLAGSKARLPEKWGEMTTMHWCLQDHFEHADIATPPSDTGREWKPRGSRYTYVIENEDCHIRVRSTNDLGLQNYFIVGIEGEPEKY